MTTMTFKEPDNVRICCQIYIATAILEFQQDFSYTSLKDKVDKAILKDIIGTLDPTTSYYTRIARSAMSNDEMLSVIEVESASLIQDLNSVELDELEAHFQKTVVKYLDELLGEDSSIRLIDFFEGKHPRIICTDLLIKIIAKI